jgi:hypothetical protein
MQKQTTGFRGATRDMFKRALASTAPQLGLKDAAEVVEALHHGRCYECGVLRTNLAREVSDYLAAVDSDLRAVYFYNPEYAAGDYQAPFSEPAKSSALYLMAWTRDNDSIPLDTIAGLTDAFDDVRMDFLCEEASRLCFSLDLTVVGDAQVKGRKGYAVMIDSLHARPIQVWPRDRVDS